MKFLQIFFEKRGNQMNLNAIARNAALGSVEVAALTYMLQSASKFALVAHQGLYDIACLFGRIDALSKLTGWVVDRIPAEYTERVASFVSNVVFEKVSVAQALRQAAQYYVTAVALFAIANGLRLLLKGNNQTPKIYTDVANLFGLNVVQGDLVRKANVAWKAIKQIPQDAYQALVGSRAAS